MDRFLMQITYKTRSMPAVDYIMTLFKCEFFFFSLKFSNTPADPFNNIMPPDETAYSCRQYSM